MSDFNGHSFTAQFKNVNGLFHDLNYHLTTVRIKIKSSFSSACVCVCVYPQFTVYYILKKRVQLSRRASLPRDQDLRVYSTHAQQCKQTSLIYTPFFTNTSYTDFYTQWFSGLNLIGYIDKQ